MNRRKLLKSTVSLTLASAFAAEAQPSSDITPETVYELRVYHLNEGKLPLILERFRTRETKIFTRLGMHNVAFFTPVDGFIDANTLVYILRHKSREAARASWAAFRVDPEWVALKAESEKDGTFVAKSESTFIKLTDFSPSL
jgi:hypothetical protein